MNRSQDTFTFTKEFGLRLRDLRLKAGLTQLELARVMGRAGKKAGNLVGRLERGEERYPSLGLIADFLRGCRSRFDDIDDILDLYTSLPIAQSKVYASVLSKVTENVVPKWQTQVTAYDRRFDHPSATDKPAAERPKPDRLKRMERVRRNAAAVSFAPGSVGEKQQVDEYILEPRWIRLGLDTALAQKLAGIVLARFRELATSFPPDPRPKR
jgi:transcriptional regulator with XRE-family HTH domain